jgi:Na+-translocating ferredoxin:NAD+ oxidoreductase RnfE subunit
MTATNEYYRYTALTLVSSLIANTTSLFNAAVALLVLLPVVLLLTYIPLQNRNLPWRIVIATAIGAGFAALLLLAVSNFLPAPWASDIVDAYGITVLLAVLAATGLYILRFRRSAISTPALSSIRFAGLLVTTGAICEALGYGMLLGDHEIAFAGATQALRIQLLDVAPLPIAATPAGALCIAAMVYGVMQWRRTVTPDLETTVPLITEPRTGRRVRVTGHIS